MKRELVEPALGMRPRGFSSMARRSGPGTGMRRVAPAPRARGAMPDMGAASAVILGLVDSETEIGPGRGDCWRLRVPGSIGVELPTHTGPGLREGGIVT